MLKERRQVLVVNRPPIIDKLEAAVRDHLDMRNVRVSLEEDLPEGPVKSSLLLFKGTQLYAQGYRVAVKGGAIRDLLTNQPASSEADLDLAVGKLGEFKPVPREEKTQVRGELIGLLRARGVTAEVDANICDLTYHMGEGPHVDSSVGAADFTINDVALTCDGEVVDRHGGVEALQLGLISLVPSVCGRRIITSDTRLRGLRMKHQYENFVISQQTGVELFKRPFFPEDLRRHSMWKLLGKALKSARDLDSLLDDLEDTGMINAIREVRSGETHYVNAPLFTSEDEPDDFEIQAAEKTGTIGKYFRRVSCREFVGDFMRGLPTQISEKLEGRLERATRTSELKQ